MLTKPGGGGRHAINVVSHSDKTLTVFDSNIGEFKLPAKDFARLMHGIGEFYGATRQLELHSVAGVHEMFSAPQNGKPAFAQLAEDTRMN